MSETTTTTPAPPVPANSLTVPAPAAQPLAREPVQFNADDPISLYMDSRIFAQLQRVAMMMARANLVPAHLRSSYKEDGSVKEDKTSDCFLVAAQAFRWRMDPFSVAQHTFVTSGKLGYEGKLIAGLINGSGKLVSNLKPVYSGGAGPERKVSIVGRIRGETEDRTIEGTVAGWATTNEKWKTMPDQMLFYRGAREWARRHMPEVMLGISADEEIVETTATVVESPRTLAGLTERLHQAAQAKPAPPAAADSTTPECAGCGKAEPVCDASDAEGRAFHAACLDVLKKAPEPEPKKAKGQGRLGE